MNNYFRWVHQCQAATITKNDRVLDVLSDKITSGFEPFLCRDGTVDGAWATGRDEKGRPFPDPVWQIPLLNACGEEKIQ